MATTSSPGCRAAALPKGRAWKLAQQMLTTARSRTLSVTQDRAAIGSGIVYYDADLYFTFDDVMVGDDVPGLALRLEDDPRAGPRTGLNPHNGGPDLLHNRTQRRRRVFGWRGSSVGVGVGRGVGVGVAVGRGVGVGMAASVAAIRASTVASMSGVGVGVAVGSAAATAACTVASISRVAVGTGVGLSAVQATATRTATTGTNMRQMVTRHYCR